MKKTITHSAFGVTATLEAGRKRRARKASKGTKSIGGPNDGVYDQDWEPGDPNPERIKKGR